MVDVDIREDDGRRGLAFVTRGQHFAFRLVKSVLPLEEKEMIISKQLIALTADGLRGSGRPTGSLAETNFWKSLFSSCRFELSSRDCESGMFRAKSLKIGSFS